MILDIAFPCMFRIHLPEPSVITSKAAICGRVKTGHLSRLRDWVLFTLLTLSCPCDSELTSPRTSCFPLLERASSRGCGNCGKLGAVVFCRVFHSFHSPSPLP